MVEKTKATHTQNTHRVEMGGHAARDVDRDGHAEAPAKGDREIVAGGRERGRCASRRAESQDAARTQRLDRNERPIVGLDHPVQRELRAHAVAKEQDHGRADKLGQVLAKLEAKGQEPVGSRREHFEGGVDDSFRCVFYVSNTFQQNVDVTCEDTLPSLFPHTISTIAKSVPSDRRQ